MLVAVLTAFAVALLIAATIIAYGRRHRPRAPIVIGRDILVPRATCVPAAFRKHPDVWSSSYSEERW